MDYRYFIAKRYLATRKQVSYISIITGISVAGVAIGVFLLIIVLSVMNGFSDVVRGLLVGLDPHIRIVHAEERGFRDADSLKQLVLDVPGVMDASSYVQGKALLVHEGTSDMNRVVIVRGVDADQARKVSRVVDQTVVGEFDLARRAGKPGMVIGMKLGQDLSLFPASDYEQSPVNTEASSVQLLSGPGMERMLTNVFATAPMSAYEIRGLYEMEPIYDETHVFVSVQEAQRLFRMQGEVSGIELRLDDIDRAAALKQEIIAHLNDDTFEVLTWYDLQKSLYDVMRLEKWGASLILVLIVVVAAFNIIGSLTMVVIEKRHDIGVLAAMGVSRKNIRRIFLLEGALIGVIGTGIGLVLGLGISLLQKYTGLVPLAGADSFILDAYPITIQPFDVSLIAIVAMGLCILAAIYPAARAAAIDPARAVQVAD